MMQLTATAGERPEGSKVDRAVLTGVDAPNETTSVVGNLLYPEQQVAFDWVSHYQYLGARCVRAWTFTGVFW